MTMRLKVATSILVVVVLHGCATASVKTPGPQPIRGIASWYGEEFAGRVTASGDIFDPLELTAAHPALPFGTIANVTNVATGATVQVRINDRGPFVRNRIVDLSFAAAQKIGLVEPGIGMVELTIVSVGDGRYRLDPALKQETKQASVDEEPPSVAFPLPDQLGANGAPPVMTEDEDFEIEVIEERGGVPVRRRVSADGRELEVVPIAGGKSTPVPPPAPPQPTVTIKYILQLGAFQSSANAETLRQKASRVVRSVYVEETEGLHRVRVGPFDSRDRALQIQEQLRRADLPSMLFTD